MNESNPNFKIKSRHKIFDRSMPRKSKHGTKISRWGTHQEMKDSGLRSKWSKAKKKFKIRFHIKDVN